MSWTYCNKSILLHSLDKQTSDRLLQAGHLPPALLSELAAGGLDSGSLRHSQPPHRLLGPQVSYSGVKGSYHLRTTNQWSVKANKHEFAF